MRSPKDAFEQKNAQGDPGWEKGWLEVIVTPDRRPVELGVSLAVFAATRLTANSGFEGFPESSLDA